MTRALRTFILIVGLIVIGGGILVAIWMMLLPSPGLDLSRSKASTRGIFQLAIEPEANSVNQGEIHSWFVTIKTKSGAAVNDAQIEVGGGMPDHNHGLPTRPKVTARLGDGRYRVEGVKFSMSGWWELRFAVSAAAGTDAATFNLLL